MRVPESHTPVIFSAILLLATISISAGDWITDWQRVTDETESLEGGRPDGRGDERRSGRPPSIGEDAWLQGRALVAHARRDGAAGAAQALTASRSTNAVLRSAAFEALGAVGDDTAIAALRQGLADPDPRAKWTAAAALAARIGEAAWVEVEPLLDAPDAATARLRSQALGAIGTPDAQAALRAMLFDPKVGATIRNRAARALHAIPEPWAARFAFELASANGDATVRKTAGGALRAHSAEQLAPILAETFAGHETNRWPTAIEVLFDRPSRSAADALAARLRDRPDSLEARWLPAALDALLVAGPGAYEESFRRYLEGGDAKIRMRAMTALAAGRTDAELFELLREPLLDDDYNIFLQAFKLLAARTQTPPPGGVAEYFREALKSSEARRLNPLLNFVEARLGPVDGRGALSALDHHLGGTNDSLRTAAANVFAMTADSATIADVLAAQGYVARWRIIGPFHNNRYNDGLRAAYPPETEVDFAKTYAGSAPESDVQTPSAGDEPVPIGWRSHRVDLLNGRVVLSQAIPESQAYAIAYAVADVECDEAQTVHMDLAVDDTIVCWLNGKIVARRDDDTRPGEIEDSGRWPEVRRKWENNEHALRAEEVALKPGMNRIVVKVGNFTDYWHFKVRLVDDKGGRAEFRQAEVVE